jgi:lysophospholipase L1-like esterase
MKISFYGDSTAFGTTLGPDGVTYIKSPMNEPSLLNQMLQARFGEDISVVNRGIGGSTSSDWLWGQRQITKSWAQEMATSDSDIVIINTGINDAYVSTFSFEDYEFAMGQFVLQAKAAGKQIALAAPNPTNDGTGSTVWSYQHIQAAVAQENAVPFISQFLAITTNVPDWKSYLPDKIHPNDDLYRFKANISYVALVKMVQAA